ncbi:molybdopterin cofactor-binding domain-containing protein [uncultured Bradyrhizobium sp.]|uniref:xanthine dehydrogenase family protein molybdopterin-binding subunit n=1 Tax=uncultured Bradyrhizobium sp. TaxID=199684 RepID=UPI0035CCA331
MNRTVFANDAKLSRRKFIVGSAAVAGGGFALGLNVPFGVDAVHAQDVATEINVWVAIKPDNTCVIRIARSEMGQGTLTGIAQLVAEELECDWNKVTTEGITPGRNLASKRAWGEMGTGGSRGIRTSEDYVRRGGAAARLMLLQAAAAQWNVPAGELTVYDGVISHGASKRSIRYGEVAASAAKLTPPDPKTVKLKDPKDWKIAGKPVKRLDTADKLDGSKVFAIDLKLPGMLNAAIKDCPVYGGKLKSYDESRIAGMPGFKKVVRVQDTAVAVVADTWWHARTALDALPVVWDEGPNASQSSAAIAEMLRDGLEASATNGDRRNGDALKAIGEAATRVDAVYSTPFLAHACMEVMNCTVKLSGDKADAWVPTQNLEASLAALSEASGIPLDKCEVHRHDLGGGFGRRGGTQDYVHQAVEIAKQFPDVPIKLIWSREEDQAHDFYRPISQCKLSAGLDAAGNLTGLHVRVSGQSINAMLNPKGIVDGKDMRQLQGYSATPGDAQLGYGVPNLLIEYAMRNTHVPVGPWRGVNTNQNGVYMECFMDEVAKAAGKDPLEFRRALMKEYPKHLGVLNAAAEKGDWGKPLPAGVHRGIAQFMGYGSYSAAVAEVSVSPQGKLKVHRMVLALNCGHAVNPGQIEAQVQGSVAYGLSATLYGEMPVENGRMTNLNFDSYEILRLAEMPKVETVVVPTYDFWGGVGEPTICVVAPAVLNAIFAATGKPVRSLPLKNVKLV